MRVTRWGKDLAVRLPRSVAETLGLTEGSEVRVSPVGGPREPSAAERDAAIARLRSLARPAPTDFVWNRQELYERDRGE